MNRLLKLTAIIEAATGLGLIAVPAIVIRLLLNAEISGATVPLSRVAGMSLLERSCSARGLVSAILLYDIGAALILASAGICSGFVGIALWPAVILHAAMAVWCVACLRRSPQNVTD